MSNETLVFNRSDVERLLTFDECIAAVENAFAQHAPDGGFHIKAALLTLDRPYFAAKTNSNSVQNRCAPRPADHPAGGDDGGIDMEIQKTARTGDRARRGVDRAGCISADTSVMP